MTIPAPHTAARHSAGLRLCLRSVTAAPHNRLNSRFAALDLASLAGYRQFLEANTAALLPLETALIHARVGRIFPDWEERSRRTAILDDLAHTGGKLVPLPLPGPLDFGSVLGTVYVLENTRMATRVLLNTVKRSTDRNVFHATAYLCHGAGRNFWQSFLSVLESHSATLHEQSAIDGAVRAYEMFERAAARVADRPATPMAVR